MFKTWLIANLEIAYLVCALIIVGISALFLPLGMDANGVSGLALAIQGIGFFSVLIVTAEQKAGPILGVIALVGLIIIMIYVLNFKEDFPEIPVIHIINTILISLPVISAVPAFFIARYAKDNFYDVVSLRWLYRNSEKDVFESMWKYTINRFCVAFLSILCLLFDLAVVIIVTVNEHSGIIDSIIQ